MHFCLKHGPKILFGLLASTSVLSLVNAADKREHEKDGKQKERSEMDPWLAAQDAGRKRDTVAAERALERAGKEPRNTPEARQELAINFCRLAQSARMEGDIEGARLAAQRALKLLERLEERFDATSQASRLADISELRAYLISEFIGDEEDARPHWEQSLQRDPERARVKERLERARRQDQRPEEASAPSAP